MQGKIGGIYVLNNLVPKRYFQLVASDQEQLNSDVIAIFHYSGELSPENESKPLTDSGVEFFTHTSVGAGIKLQYWQKVTIDKPVNYSLALFKDVVYRDDGLLTDWESYEKDYYHSWVIWKINEPRKKIGSNIDKYPQAELGAVFPPRDIVERIRDGKYPGVPYYG